ncbi:fatty acid desaturase [Nocardia crassostreae]|uniref:fatty acid desaturase n=1 Tax=Nocardia crassostreae TaxID=53428 RepID=UPI000836995C|nr:fatty acid desaturase [Nocardia crassostreae]
MTDARTAGKARVPHRNRRPERRVTLWLTGVALALGAFQMVLLPVILLPRDAAWGWLLLPLALLTTPFWSVIHESIHGTLTGRRGLNDRCGRALAVLYGSPFTLLKTGHLLHHRYSRTRERTEIYDPATSSWAKTAPGYYLRLFGGLYLLEAAAVVLAVLPAAALRALGRRLDSPDTVTGPLFERIAQPGVLRQFRIDAAAIIALYAGALLAYGAHAWMLLAAIGGRAVIISVSDNAYHYGTDLDAPLEALNLRLPRGLERFALSFNLHGVHHRHPGLRWYELRGAFLAEDGRYDLGWLGAAARQLRGPIELP